MGLYLNSRRPRNNYLEIVRSDYFTDKTTKGETKMVKNGQNSTLKKVCCNSVLI